MPPLVHGPCTLLHFAHLCTGPPWRQRAAGLRARGPRVVQGLHGGGLAQGLHKGAVQGLHGERVSAEVQHGHELVQGACYEGVSVHRLHEGSVQGLHRGFPCKDCTGVS